MAALGFALLCGFEWGGHAESLSEALRSGSHSEQLGAVEALSSVPRSHPAWRDAFALRNPDLLANALRHFARVAEEQDAETLAAFASHPQPGVRAATLYIWERIRPEGSAAMLVRAMSDSDARVRAQAARSLTGFNSDAVVRALEQGLDDPDERVRTAAIESLGKADNALKMRALRKAASDAEPKLRSAALRALALTEGSSGIIYQGVQDRDSTVRAAAVAALGNSTDPAAIELLANIIDQDSAANARLALEALLYHERPAATDALLARIDGIIRHGLIDETATALPHLSPAAQRRWRDKLADALQSGSNPTAHVRLLVSLARSQPHDVSEAEGVLLELANRSGDAQLDALRLLGSCRSDRALVTLVRAIDSDDDAIRRQALDGLTDFQELNPRDERIADGLLEALQNASANIRPEIIERIGATGASRLAPRLLPLLDLQQPSILLATLKALSKMPHPKSAAKLRTLLAHSHAKVRWTAAIALGSTGSAADREWLQEQLMRDHPWDRAALLIALREIVAKLGPDDDTRDTLESFLTGERENLAALSAIIVSELAAPEDIKALRALLMHASPVRRALAAAHLAVADDPKTRAALIGRARDANERTQVRIAALSALAMQNAANIPHVDSPWAVKLASECAQFYAKQRSPESDGSKRRIIAMPPATNVPLRHALRALRFSDGRTLWVTTDALGELHLWGAPKGPVELFDPVARPPDCTSRMP